MVYNLSFRPEQFKAREQFQVREQKLINKEQFIINHFKNTDDKKDIAYREHTTNTIR
jgi:hypothetical protein